jgi:hypothetical protein
MVMVVDDPEKGIGEGNIVAHMGGGKPCKHLLGSKPGDYSCAIHGKRWYRKTPCFAHGQIEASKEDPCRLGEYILKRTSL